MFAVAGVSGRTGAATAEALLKQGQKVRALVRTGEQAEPWRKRHAEVAVVDLTDGAALAAALQGVSGAYLLLPPNPSAADLLADRAAFLERVVAGLKRARLESLVFLSCVGAQHPAKTGAVVALHRAEKALTGLARSVTFLRAAFFLENWAGELLPALETGELRHFGDTHHKFPQVCAHDVGVAAAKALVEHEPGARALELAGREDWSVDDVAGVLASLLGSPIKAVSLPVESARDTLVRGGMPEPAAALAAEQYQARARGLLGFAHPHGVLRGTTPLFDALKPLV